MLAGYDHLLRAAERLRWDERDIDLRGDGAAWPSLQAPVRDALTRLFAGFWVAEHAVAEHLAPFAPASGDPQLAACFAAQASDERRHARFFSRVAREVMAIDPERDARRLAGPALVELFELILPRMAGGLAEGERDLSEAVSFYHLVLEGLVFGVGQEAALALLDAAGTLPGVRDGVARVQGDERWHVGLGVRCLTDVGVASEAVLARAEAAANVWGDAAPPELAATALVRHGRRLREAGYDASLAGAVALEPEA